MKTPAQCMKAKRDREKTLGLVPCRYKVTPEIREEIKRLIIKKMGNLIKIATVQMVSNKNVITNEPQPTLEGGEALEEF